MKLLIVCSTALLATSTAPPQKHLVVLVHGLSGTAADLATCAPARSGHQRARAARPARTSPSRGPWTASTRAALESPTRCGKWRCAQDHQLRALAAALHARAALRELRDGDGTFAGLTPAIFVTTAAPHLGARQTQYGPLAPLLRLCRRSSRDLCRKQPVKLGCSKPSGPTRSWRQLRVDGLRNRTPSSRRSYGNNIASMAGRPR